jgi:rhomboid protease GluP
MALFAAIYTLSLHFDAGRERTLLQTRAISVLIPSLIPLGASIGGGRVDYGAHLGGAVAGAALGLVLLRAWPRTEVLPRFRRGAAVLACVGAIAFGAALFVITQNYQRFARGAELIPLDQIPKTDAEIPARSKDLLARYPHDPRAHFFEAITLLKVGDMASGEHELRAALAEEDTIRLSLSREFEMRVRGLLAIVLAGQGRTAEANSEAKPACASTDTAQQMKGLMDKGHLCD